MRVRKASDKDYQHQHSHASRRHAFAGSRVSWFESRTALYCTARVNHDSRDATSTTRHFWSPLLSGLFPLRTVFRGRVRLVNWNHGIQNATAALADVRTCMCEGTPLFSPYIHTRRPNNSRRVIHPVRSLPPHNTPLRVGGWRTAPAVSAWPTVPSRASAPAGSRPTWGPRWLPEGSSPIPCVSFVRDGSKALDWLVSHEILGCGGYVMSGSLKGRDPEGNIEKSGQEKSRESTPRSDRRIARVPTNATTTTTTTRARHSIDH